MEYKQPEKIEHLLALKVMRLTKPTLSSPLIVTNEIKDLPESILNNELKNDITSVEGSETLAVGQFLLAPQTSGNIYLGESFISYVFVHNNSSHTVKNVTLKADLQTTNQKISLCDCNTGELVPENAIDQVIHHEVKEIGTHILACDVSYVSPAGDPLSFRKYYKFQVFKPLDVKTKFYIAESDDEVFLEAEVQNITAGPISLEKVSLESTEMYKVSSLNNMKESKPGEGLLQPEASRQYLYCLTPVHGPGEVDVKATDIGRLDIAWRSALGERGRLQTSQLNRTIQNPGDIHLSIHNVPNIVKIEEPFTFTCKIANLSKKSMDLVLDLEDLYPNLFWIGTSGRNIGRLEKGGFIMIDLTLVPLNAGLHNISGIRFRNLFSSSTYEYDDVAQVFVT